MADIFDTIDSGTKARGGDVFDQIDADEPGGRDIFDELAPDEDLEQPEKPPWQSRLKDTITDTSNITKAPAEAVKGWVRGSLSIPEAAGTAEQYIGNRLSSDYEPDKTDVAPLMERQGGPSPVLRPEVEYPREDGTLKGPGWQGSIQTADGKGVMTEKSIGVHFDGKEHLIPLIVPGTTPDEIQAIAAGEKPESAVDKAVAFARERIAAGQSPFKEGEFSDGPQSPPQGFQPRDVFNYLSPVQQAEVGNQMAGAQGDVTDRNLSTAITDSIDANRMEASPEAKAVGAELIAGGKATVDYYKRLAKPYEQDRSLRGKNLWDNPELLANASWWASGIGEMGPSVAASIIPAIGAQQAMIRIGSAALPYTSQTVAGIGKLASMIGAGVGGSAGGVLEASGTYQQILEKGGTEEEAARAAELMGAASALLNSVGNMQILDGIGETFLSKTGTSALVEAITEGAEEPAEVASIIMSKMITGQDLPENIKKMFIDSAKSALTVAPIAAIMGGGASALTYSADTADSTQSPPAAPTRPGATPTASPSAARRAMDAALGDDVGKTAKEILTGEKEQPAQKPAPAPVEPATPDQSLDAEEAAAEFTDEELDAAANEAATSPANDRPEPTDDQKKAGNFKKGHPKPGLTRGLAVTIENPKGSTRTQAKPDNAPDDWTPEWSTEVKSHYGYFKRSEGKDGEQIDVFLSDTPNDGKTFIIDQQDPDTGKFDEHKVMMGFADEKAARAAYMANYKKGWKGLEAITEVTDDALREFVGSGKRQTKAYAQGAKDPKLATLTETEITRRISNLETARDKYLKRLDPKQEKTLAALRTELEARGSKSAQKSADVFTDAMPKPPTDAEARKQKIEGLTAGTGKSAAQSAEDMAAGLVQKAATEEVQRNEAIRRGRKEAPDFVKRHPELSELADRITRGEVPTADEVRGAVTRYKRDEAVERLGGDYTMDSAPNEVLLRARTALKHEGRPDLVKVIDGEIRNRKIRSAISKASKDSKITTLSGWIESVGGLNLGNLKTDFTEKFKDQRVARLLKKGGLEIEELEKNGPEWLIPGELAHILLNDPQQLRRGKLSAAAKTKWQKEQQARTDESAEAPDDNMPPDYDKEGEYQTILAGDLEEGHKGVIVIDGKWGEYTVKSADPFSDEGIVLKAADGTSVTLKPTRQIEVKGYVEKKAAPADESGDEAEGPAEPAESPDRWVIDRLMNSDDRVQMLVDLSLFNVKKMAPGQVTQMAYEVASKAGDDLSIYDDIVAARNLFDEMVKKQTAAEQWGEIQWTAPARQAMQEAAEFIEYIMHGKGNPEFGTAKRAARWADGELTFDYDVLIRSVKGLIADTEERKNAERQKEAVDRSEEGGLGSGEKEGSGDTGGTEKGKAEETPEKDQGVAAADAWLKHVTEGVRKLEDKHGALLSGAYLYENFKKNVTAGRLTADRFKEMQDQGKLISDDEYARAQSIRAEIEKIKAASIDDFKAPQAEPKAPPAPQPAPTEAADTKAEDIGTLSDNAIDDVLDSVFGEEPSGIDHEALALYDEEQALLRKLPSNMGKAKAENKLSKNQLSAMDRLDEIHKTLPNTSDRYAAAAAIRRKEWESRMEDWRAGNLDDAKKKMAKTGFSEGDEVEFLIQPMFLGAPATHYRGTVTISKNGTVYVKAYNLSAGKRRAERLSLFNNPWSKVDPKPKPTTKALAKKAGVESVKGVQAAIKGLSELFTPKNTLTSGIIFNEDTYAQAKPHFQSALKHAIEAGHTVGDLVKHLYDTFGAQIRPYLKRFMQDQREGAQDGKEAEAATEAAQTPEVRPGEKGKAEDADREPAADRGDNRDQGIKDSPIANLESALRFNGAGNIDIAGERYYYKISSTSPDNFYYQRTNKGIRSEKGGGYPARWSMETAILEAIDDARSLLKSAPAAPTKKEKALKEYRDFVASLTDEQRASAGDLVVDDPGSPSLQMAKIQKALDATTKAQPEDAKAKKSAALAQWIYARISREDGPISWQRLFEQADKEFGGTQAQGAYTPKDAYDAMELGVNTWLEDNKELASHITSSDPGDAVVAVSVLKQVVDQLPTQTKRTTEQDQYQQFSTPPALAFVANWVANIKKGEQYHEPSAGVGGIAVFGKMAGANVTVNEFSQRRAALLKRLKFDRVFTENAEQLDNILPKDVKPTVIVMNPPFSATAGRVSKNKTKYGAKHIEQALARLEPGGRLVAIVGKGMAMDAATFKDWWARIQSKYAVRANVSISGNDYKKYGTTFDNQILVIDKINPDGNPVVTGFAEKFDDLPGLLKEVRHDRPSNVEAEQSADQPADSGSAQGAGAVPGTGQTARPATSGVGHGSRPGARTPGAGSALPFGENIKTGKPPARPSNALEAEGSGKPDVPGKDAEGAPGNGGVGGDRGRSAQELSLESRAAPQAAGDLTDSIYDTYTPRVKISGAKPHPSPLVESAAMAAIQAPPINYTPNIPSEPVKAGKISDIQLEAVAAAGVAHQEELPNGSRKGFFIGDGTGVGKGREISGIIWDNWRQGRQKALWVSENFDLAKDAKRDLIGVGWQSGAENLKTLKAFKTGKAIAFNKGILFASYDTVRGQGASSFAKIRQDKPESLKDLGIRLNQIVSWLGKDFDGVIAFDESHNMANAAPQRGDRGVKPPSGKALAGIMLQEMLPKARVVYVSATGATEVSNLVYASRLGLWGPGTPFESALHFVNSISSGGVAAMELIAGNLKAMGLYTARSLSYDGVAYDRITHELTDSQRRKYNELAGAWQIVLQNINEAVELTGGKAKWSQFWGAQQRFFNQIITTMQMPSAISAIKNDIEAGNAVVLQLVNTDEAQQERALSRRQDGEDLEDLDMTPREALMGYLERSFPVQEWEEYEDEEGRLRTRPVYDAAGDPVINREAERMRDQLMTRVAAIKMPNGPLDFILEELGANNVAEVTGRSRRVVTDNETGKMVIERRSDKHVQADVDAFMEDRKQILVFSGKGATGRSFHADLTKKNQRKRRHYLIQPGWRADKAVQGLGRSHRSNQATLPEFILVTTDLNAQKRFISSIARRLDQLGALTKGQRQTGSQGIFQAKDNLESQYAVDALHRLIDGIVHNTEDGITLDDFQAQTGLNLINEEGGLEVPNIRQFLNRLLSMTIDQQNAVFDAFMRHMDDIIEAHQQRGTLDVGIETIRGDKVEKVGEQTVYKDKRTGAEAKYIQLDVTNPAKTISFEQSKSLFNGNPDGYYRNIRSGMMWAASWERTRTGSSGEVVGYRSIVSPRFTTRRIDSVEISNSERWEKLTGKAAEKAWADAYEKLPKTETERHHIITGALLPVWNQLKGPSRIFRMQTDEGERFLGRVIHPDHLGSTLSGLDVQGASQKVAGATIVDRVLNESATYRLDGGWRIKRSVVSGDERIEIVGPEYDDMQFMDRIGAITERIQWATRYFVPTTNSAGSIIDRIVRKHPVMSVDSGESSLDQVQEGGNNYDGGRPNENPIKVREPKDRRFNKQVQARLDKSTQLSLDFSGRPAAGKSKASGSALRSTERQSVVMVRTGWVGHASEVANNSEEIVSLLAGIRSSAQENLYTVAVDKNGKILEIQRYTKGQKASSPAVPSDMAGSAFRVAGTAKVYMVHNHPSGDPSPSVDDVVITSQLQDILSLRGIKTESVVIGRDTWSGVDPATIGSGLVSPAKAALVKIPVSERILKWDPAKDKSKIVRDPDELNKVLKDDFGDRDGIVFLDGKNRVLGVLDWPSGKRMNEAAAEVLATVDEVNASAMIFVGKNKGVAGTNREAFIYSLAGLAPDVTIHDVVGAPGEREIGSSVRAKQKIIAGETGAEAKKKYIKNAAKRLKQGDILFRQTKSRNPKRWHTQSAAAVERQLSDIWNSWKNPPFGGVKVYQKQAQLLERVREMTGGWNKADRDEVLGYMRGSVVDAMIFNDTVFIVADNIASPREAVVAMFHEAFGHYGVEGVMGEAFDSVLADVFEAKQGDAAMEKIIAQYKLDVTKKADQRTAAREWLAKQSEGLPKASLLDKLIRQIRAWLRSLNIEFKITDGEIRAWLADAREFVQRGTTGVGRQAAPAFSSEPTAPQWYSALVEGVDALKQKKAPASQWLAMINKIPGVKQEEIEWVGLTDWLNGQEGKVTKQQILDFVAAGGVQIQEVVKGENKDVTSGPVARAIEIAEKYDVPYDVYTLQNSPAEGIDNISIELFDIDSSAPELRELENLSKQLEDGIKRGDTKFAQWQLPGGSNYKELLLTLPVQRRAQGKFIARPLDTGNWEVWDADRNIRQRTAFNRQEAEMMADEFNSVWRDKKYVEDKSKTYRVPSAHAYGDDASDVNRLAHVRFNNRTGPSGEKILFLEEVQSDWHQAGRKKGYKSDRLKQKNFATWLTDNGKNLTEEERESQFKSRKGAEVEAWKAEQDAALKNAMAVPNAPFKATDTWALLALKRMVRYAAENGYDTVAWTTGEQQADRYDLSKQIDTLLVVPGPENGTYNVTADKAGDVVVNENAVPANKLPDMIGKELAERVINDTAKGLSAEYSGLDLKVGGEGMKAFYDKILPAAANKFFGKKAWGGARVETGKVLSGRDQKTVAAETRGGVKIHISEDQDGSWWAYDSSGLIIGDDGFATAESAARANGAKITTQPHGFDAWTLPITPEIRRKALTEGMPMFLFGGLRGADRKGTLALKTARKMQRDGASRFKVWKETGWYEIIPGSGQWSLEIDDSAAVLSPEKVKTAWELLRKIVKPGATKDVLKYSTPLGDLITHKELFGAYPELENIGVSIIVNKMIDSPSGRLADGKWITVNAPNLESARLTLLHEVQHAIQELEGFARGGSESSFAMGIRQDEMPKAQLDAISELEAAIKAGDNGKYQRLQDEYQKSYGDFGLYRRLTGEAESRLVQARANLTPEQRRSTPPWRTLSLMLKSEGLLKDGQKPEDVLISRMGGGQQAASFKLHDEPAVDEGFLPDKVEESFAKSRGVTPDNWLTKLKSKADEVRAGREHFPKLITIEDKKLRHRLADILRIHQEIPETVKDKTIRAITDFTEGLSRQEFEAYRKHIILSDIARDINKGLLEGEKVPFGFENTDQVLEALDKYKDLAAKNKKIGDALKKRDKFVNNLKRDLVDAKLLKKEVLADDDYFHHQVLMYWGERRGLSTSSSDVRTKWRPWQVARKGSVADYNTEYVEAEFVAIHQQMAQLETHNTLKRIKKLADIYADLKGQAKRENLEAVYKKAKEQADKLIDGLPPEDPLAPFKSKIAYNTKRLYGLIVEGKTPMDGDFGELVDELTEAYREWQEVNSELDKEEQYPFMFDHPQWFAYLGYLTRLGQAGSKEAATIFKAIRARDKFIEDYLGDDFKTYKDVMPEGYTQWKPDPNKAWFWTNSVADNILERLIAGEISPKDVEFRKILARGRDLIWIIPQGLADTMDNMRDPIETRWPGRLSGGALRAWKQYILMNPYSVIRYNINNLSGDLDVVLAYSPTILKHVPQAVKDLMAWNKKTPLGAALQRFMDRARELGVIGSGWSVQEVEDLVKIKGMDKLTRHAVMDEKVNWFNPVNFGAKYWDTVRSVTAMRENVLRLAAYRWFLENSDRAVYGASKPEEIAAIKAKDERAAKLARELLGDYGNISHSGQWIRRHLMPFYAWLEINSPRYVYMLRNSKYEDGGAPGRVLAVGAKKAIWSASKYAVKASMLYGAIHLWNMLMFPDEEDDLGESGRRQLHIILGRRDDGSIITLRFQGALSDAMSFFGLEDLPDDIKDLARGKATITGKIVEAGKALTNRAWQSVRPEVKMASDVATGMSTYPDAFRPVPIRDRVEHVLRTFKLDSIYRVLNDRPAPGKNPKHSEAARKAEHFVNDLKRLLVYDTDPGVQAYYDTRRMVIDWQAKNGDERAGMARPNKKGNAIYWYKQALKYGDFKAAEKYLDRYYELGGSPKAMVQSIKRAHPLSGIPKVKRYQFRKSLTPAEDAAVQLGLEWYRKTYGGVGG